MGKLSRNKGARFERQLAGMFRDYGYDARRTAQFCGNTGDAADVIGLPGIHVEAKHYASRGFDYDWLEQAKRDSEKSGNIPTVFHKIDNHEVVVTMRLDDWFKLYREWEAGNGGAQNVCENNN